MTGRRPRVGSPPGGPRSLSVLVDRRPGRLGPGDVRLGVGVGLRAHSGGGLRGRGPPGPKPRNPLDAADPVGDAPGDLGSAPVVAGGRFPAVPPQGGWGRRYGGLRIGVRHLGAWESSGRGSHWRGAQDPRAPGPLVQGTLASDHFGTRDPRR